VWPGTSLRTFRTSLLLPSSGDQDDEQIPPKLGLTSTRLPDATTQKTAIFTLAAVRTSNSTLFTFPRFSRQMRQYVETRHNSLPKNPHTSFTTILPYDIIRSPRMKLTNSLIMWYKPRSALKMCLQVPLLLIPCNNTANLYNAMKDLDSMTRAIYQSPPLKLVLLTPLPSSWFGSDHRDIYTQTLHS
jgi:hypothetical protein